MALALYLTTERRHWWLEHLQSLLPDIECQLWDSIGDRNHILYAVVWRPAPGWLATLPNLKCIISIGAGIDHILEDPQLPTDIPIIRTTGEDLTTRMREYVCLHVLRYHRQLTETLQAQSRQQWEPVITPPASQTQVGIMGLGKLGSDAARCLATIGFKVAGWATSKHHIKGVKTYTGSELSLFLQHCNILVCLLPLTASTQNILCRELFDQLPTGACIINAARGEHLLEEDLLDALDSGRIGYATLDVFRQEPLPSGHPFWTHNKILVTPHIASMIDPQSGGKEIANNLRAFINGYTTDDLTDLTRGY